MKPDIDDSDHDAHPNPPCDRHHFRSRIQVLLRLLEIGYISRKYSNGTGLFLHSFETCRLFLPHALA
jgi:hypothetical protein